MNSKTILISGISGFIGKNILASSFFDSFNLICLIRDDTSLIELNRIKPGIKFINYKEIDDLLLNKFQVDFFLHLAAYGVNPQNDKIDEFISSNISLTTMLFELAAKIGVKYFINIGSVSEYGNSNYNSKITEHTIPKPINLYGGSKYSSHIILKILSDRFKLKFITIRPFNLFGMFESNGRLYPQVIKSGSKNIPLALTPGDQIKNINFIFDFIYFLKLLILNYETINSDTINFTNSIPISIKDFVKTICKELNYDINLYHFGKIPYRQNEQMYSVGNNSLLLHYFPNFSFTPLNISIRQSFMNYL